MGEDAQHYNQRQKRQAEFIQPPNLLKKKVGGGGLGSDVLDKAQKLLEENTVDFPPLADAYLESLMHGINETKDASTSEDNEYLISTMLYPALQLKANGGMFHYPLITAVADRLVQFMEVIEEPDIEALEIIIAFHTSIKAVLDGRASGDAGEYGQELIKALDSACMRYFDKYQRR